jgi:hypothetical protein
MLSQCAWTKRCAFPVGAPLASLVMEDSEGGDDDALMRREHNCCNGGVNAWAMGFGGDALKRRRNMPGD